jgi:hypothetical protein
MPKASGKAGNEIVIIQFKVSSEGEVGDLRSLQGQKSASLSMLMTSLAKWKFAPASNGTAPIPATGKVLLIKGEDQFRYEVSSSYSGTVSTGNKPTDRGPTSSASSNSGPVIVVVPVKTRLEPDEANSNWWNTSHPSTPVTPNRPEYKEP